MKKSLLIPVFAAVFSGCCAYTDIGHLKSSATAGDGERALATVSVFNVSYSIFGVIPLESGTTWKTGPSADQDWWNATWFSDRCTLDENLASLRAALAEIGSSRIENLVTESDSWRFWSLFIVKRKVMKTTCTVLKQGTAK